MDDLTNTVAYKVGAPIASFLAGVAIMLYQRSTLTRKEKTDLAQKDYENTERLLKDLNASYQLFSTALHKYNGKTEDVDFDDFINIATEGEKYFTVQAIAANAILAGRVEHNSIKGTFMPKFTDTVERILPRYYSTLQKIAEKKGYPYTGTLERKNYESIYQAVEKHSHKQSAYLHGPTSSI